MKVKSRYGGFTLTELASAMLVTGIVVLAAGTLLVSGHRSWQRTYDSAHRAIEEDAHKLALTFGSMARRANRQNYRLYKKLNNQFFEAQPDSEDLEVVFGDALEFRYWDVPLDESDSYELMDEAKTATAYILFYIEGSELKADYGPYPPGGVSDGGGGRNGADVSTLVLARNVAVESREDGFSHTTINGVGQGSVRIDVRLEDPDNGDRVRVMTSAMLRNTWPK